ncbi:Wzz/FepE/Etk N-terminal domain-containing protein [Arcobacter aquimarinus]|uniref:Chain length determinant protein, Wzz family n=1 Tax=Arcobacter aquimarinus TaxID=1315211 RepID=A0AAE7B473_9BACT|nr:Wzz/FepE/Etk N-terminal domain-containing protein [Arcobacter aquimarinus]QKE26731.1 putative chain length determinant protein, Wzz family [Arcobacter aquimarinus]RXI34465.1 hypothetical protein CP986_09420 [Arcobacter aquimarinus]
MQNKEYIVEDEIDLKELFKTIWNKRVFILVFTAVVTGLAIAFAYIKTPIYSVKALVEIGTFKTDNDKNTYVDDADSLSKKLSMIFIDLRENIEDKKYEIVNISIPKGMKNFIEITSESTSNDEAINGIKEILDYVKEEHSKLLADVREKNIIEIKNIDISIKNIEEDKITSINKKIDLLNQNISNLEEQMSFVTETLKNINKLDPSISALKLMEKRDISNAIVENKSDLYDLIEAKESLMNVDINKLLERKKLLESLTLEHNLKNTEIVGNILVDEDPEKPKKALIVIVGFVTGFIISIFLVFIMQFINNIRKEEN